MSVLVDKDTKVVVQGITGTAASFHTENMLNYGTKIAAGVRPGAGGKSVKGVPVYDTCSDVMKEHNIDVSILFVPPGIMKKAAFEALDAGIKLLVMVSEHVPLHDTVAIIQKAEKSGAGVIGPNTPGLIAPDLRCKIGFVPEKYFIPGSVGVASRSGTLTYEIVSRLTQRDIGQSFCVGVGGDPIVGKPFPQIAELMEEDPSTELILLIGEIGGTAEEETAEMIAKGDINKPVVAYIAGRTAPPDKRMGHAGAIIAGNKGTIESKLNAFENAGVPVAEVPAEVPGLVHRELSRTEG